MSLTRSLVLIFGHESQEITFLTQLLENEIAKEGKYISIIHFIITNIGIKSVDLVIIVKTFTVVYI